VGDDVAVAVGATAGVAVGATAAVAVAVATGVAATALATTNSADATAAVPVFLFPLLTPTLAPFTVTETEAAWTWCVPGVDVGTVSVVRNDPLPPTLIAVGMPTLEPSHVI
jgi:hypothetical protein